jgi:nucleotide-binding universal stress UspA family protein
MIWIKGSRSCVWHYLIVTQEPAMTYKTILVHCDSSRTVNGRLAAAADVAQRFEARLIGLHAREPLEVASFVDGGMGIGALMESWQAGCDAAEKTAETAYAKATKGRNFPAEWRVIEAFSDDALAVNGRYADLLVVGQADPDDPAGSRNDLPEAMAFATGRPILVVPQIGAQPTVGKTVLLCWNASRESARAAADALPFLRAADKVIVLIVDPEISADGHGEEPGADVALWLARHGVNITVQRDVAADARIGEIILSRAADYGADLIVMGIYGHSRLREMVLGGVSRTLLASMTVPVLMSH